jgi:hypothetical protein
VGLCPENHDLAAEAFRAQRFGGAQPGQGRADDRDALHGQAARRIACIGQPSIASFT